MITDGVFPRVAWMQCSEFQLESRAETFYAFFLLHGRLMSVHRRFNLDLPHNSLSAERYASEIILSEYTEDGGQITRKMESLLCQGEDPRVVSDGTRAYVLCRPGIHEDSQSAGHYRLVALPDRVVTGIHLPQEMQAGKNWQPFIQAGRLLVVHGFDPVTLFEIREDGSLGQMNREVSQFAIPAAHDGYTMVRGGSNGVEEEGVVYGLGHMTVRRYDHRPFFWTLNHKRQIYLHIPPGFLGLREKGFNIVDPTSLFLMNGRVYLGVAASERDWFYPQRFLDMLVEFPLSAVSELASFSRSPVAVELDSPEWHCLPASRTIFPEDLCHQIQVDVTPGGIRSRGDSGCLIHGPYLPVREPGNFVASLTYSSPCAMEDEQVGSFDISFYLDGESRGEAACPMYGTNDRPLTLELPFSTDQHVGTLLETRVHASGNAQIEIFNIRIMQSRNPGNGGAVE